MSQRGGRHRKESAGRSTAPQPVTPESLLQEAETLQQRAERKSGRDAPQAFEAAAAKFQQALQAGLSQESQADAAFGQGECLQLWADAEVQLLQEAPDEALTQQLQQQVRERAAGLYQSSVQAYQQVQQPASEGASAAAAGGLRPDAGVNAANALCSWAELVQGPQRAQLLQQAVALYRAALAQEEDAATLSNLGDALVAQGEAALQSGEAEAGQAAFGSALEAYQASCSLSDSSAGDDLPGLLHNWGVGLHTISKQAQDCPLKQSLLQQAADKLRASITFSRADPAPHNALGDVLMDAAELVANLASSSSSAATAGDSSGGFGGAVALPAAAAEQAAALLKQAVDEGYSAALSISRSNADALVGTAEASVAMAKLARRQGDQAAAAAHITAAVGHYSSALQRPHLLGDAADRADIRYNAACAAALAGQHSTAQQLLTYLAAAGTLSAADMATDEDIASIRGQQWFQELVRGLQAT